MVYKTHASCVIKDMNYYNICCPLMIGTADQLTHTMMTSFKNITNINEGFFHLLSPMHYNIFITYQHNYWNEKKDQYSYKDIIFLATL